MAMTNGERVAEGIVVLVMLGLLVNAILFGVLIH